MTLLLTGAVLIGPFSFLSAQPVGNTVARALTWEDCVTLAYRNNPDLASSDRAREANRASFRGSFNGLLPSLTVSNVYNNSDSSDGSSRWQTEGAANLQLLNAGQIAGIKSSAASLSQAEANLQVTSSSLRFSLRKAFAQVLFSEQNVDVSRAIRDMRQKDSQLVTLRYQSGREYKGNMMRAQAQYLQAEADYRQALRDFRASQKGLDRQLGLDDFSDVAATGTLAAQEPPELPTRMETFLGLRPDMALQEAVIRSAEASVSQARSSLWPSLSANYSRFHTGMDDFGPGRYGWTLQGVLSYPLFGGGPTSTYYAVASAKRSLEKSKQDLRSVRDQAIFDLETAWSSYASAFDQVKVQTSLLVAARQRNDEADVRYASGLLTFDNWELIVSDRVNQERAAISAYLNAVIAEAGWAKSLGKRLGE